MKKKTFSFEEEDLEWINPILVEWSKENEGKSQSDLIVQLLKEHKDRRPTLKESLDEDPVIRELALFGLTFSAEASARQRLRELKNEEWPKWFNANIEPRIAELQAKVNANALQLLKGPWTFTCDRCGTRFDAEVTAEGIEQLLRSGQVKSECANPQCEDHSLFSTRRHTLQVSLHDLIKVRIPG